MKPNQVVWILAVAALGGCMSQPRSENVDEHGRVQVHLAGALALLETSDPPNLSAEQRARRKIQIDNLREYIAAGRYPINRQLPFLSPIFVDERGARCAVAALLERSGHGRLVQRIASERNFAYVVELGDSPELREWLSENGLTLGEVARIQPEYAPPFSAWEGTASLHGGIGPRWFAGRPQALALVGARAGFARRTIDPIRGRVTSSLLLAGQYEAWVPLTQPFTHVVGPVSAYHWHLTRHLSLYALAGVSVALPNAATPLGIGGQLGMGGDLQPPDWPVKIFAEATARYFRIGVADCIAGTVQLGVGL
jgi:hypothetical protein